MSSVRGDLIRSGPYLSVAARRAVPRRGEPIAIDRGPLLLLAYLLWEEGSELRGPFSLVGAGTRPTFEEWRNELSRAMSVASISEYLESDGAVIRLKPLPRGRCDLADVLEAIKLDGDVRARRIEEASLGNREAMWRGFEEVIDPRTAEGRRLSKPRYDKRYAAEAQSWREALCAELSWHLRGQTSPASAVEAERRRQADRIELELKSGLEAKRRVPTPLRRVTGHLASSPTRDLQSLLFAPESRVLLTGPAGIGKTTAALEAALDFAKRTRNGVPYLINAAVEEYPQPPLHLGETAEVVFVHDGVDDVDDRAGYARTLRQFVHATPTARHIVLARDSWGLDGLPMFVQYELERPDSAEIETALSLYGLDQHEDIVDLCRTPMYLTMALHMADEPAALPTSRYALYERFIDLALDRHGNRRVLPRADAASSKAYIGLAAPLRQHGELRLEDAVAALESAGVDASLIEAFLSSPILRVGNSRQHGRLAGTFVSWVHPSFGEFFTAREGWNRVTAGTLPLQRLAQYLGAHERAFEALRFAVERASEPQVLLAAISEQTDLNIVLTAAAGAVATSPLTVGDLVIRALDTFKWCEPPCNYPIIRSARALAGQLPIDVVGEALAGRLLDDLDYLDPGRWADPRLLVPRLGDERATSHLVHIARDDESTVEARVEALATLATRYEQRAAETLVALATTDGQQLIRLAAILALQSHSSVPGLDRIRECAVDPAEDPVIQARALDLCGLYPDPKVANALLTVLERAAENPAGVDSELDDITDSAAWSICRHGLSDSKILSSIDGYDRLLRLLRQPLPHYTLATIAYALGTSGEVRYAPAIVEAVGDRRDPYLLEDVCHALGELGDRALLDYLRQLVVSVDDTVVHRHAILAARALGSGDSVVDAVDSLELPWVARAETDALADVGYVKAAIGRASR